MSKVYISVFCVCVFIVPLYSKPNMLLYNTYSSVASIHLSMVDVSAGNSLSTPE